MAKTKASRRKRPQTAGRGATPRRRTPPPRQRTRPVILGAAVAVIALVVVVALLVNRDGGEGERADDSAGAQPGAAAITGPDFHSLTADPVTPGRLFAGGHQNVSVSIDNGRTWSEIQALRDADAMGWGFAADAVYVSGHPGLNRSTDDARTFDRINQGLPGTDVHAFGAGQTTLYGAAAGVGVFSSTDGGTTWRTVNNDAGAAFFGRILVDADDEQHLVAADARTGPVESNDGGRTWTPLDAGIPATWVSGTNDLEQLIASGPQGAAKSTDGGANWQPLELPDGASLVELSPDGTTLLAGVHRPPSVEVYLSRDGGSTWERP